MLSPPLERINCYALPCKVWRQPFYFTILNRWRKARVWQMCISITAWIINISAGARTDWYMTVVWLLGCGSVASLPSCVSRHNHVSATGVGGVEGGVEEGAGEVEARGGRAGGTGFPPYGCLRQWQWLPWRWRLPASWSLVLVLTQWPMVFVLT